jgi:hypothetical protein
LFKRNKLVCFLDEKWFYTVSRRKKIKWLPPTKEELQADKSLERPKAPKVVSRRHTVKVMFLGVVARPSPEHRFDGRICFTRVAEEKARSRKSVNQNFTDDGALNHDLKVEKVWRQLFEEDEGMTAEMLLDIISEAFDLHDIRQKLTLRAQLESGKWVSMKESEDIDAFLFKHFEEDASIGKVELGVEYRKGEKKVEDVSCDSKYMLNVMKEIVGPAIRNAFHWADKDETIYLVMDNAGGHGTDEAIEQYTKYLWEEHKIEIIWQVPRSPETNMLDLGLWRSIQSAVEKVHAFKVYDADALARSAEKAWRNRLQSGVFERVFQRLLKVLKIIEDDNGGNDFVEGQRGKQFFSDPIFDDMVADEDADVAVEEADN